jgi:hypothetical protein
MYVCIGQKDIFVFQKLGPKSSAKYSYLGRNVLECFYFLPPRLLEQNSCQCWKVGGVPGNLLYLISLSATSVVFFMGVSSSLQFEIRLQSSIHPSGLRSETRDAKSRISYTTYEIFDRKKIIAFCDVMSCSFLPNFTTWCPRKQLSFSSQPWENQNSRRVIILPWI